MIAAVIVTEPVEPTDRTPSVPPAKDNAPVSLIVPPVTSASFGMLALLIVTGAMVMAPVGVKTLVVRYPTWVIAAVIAPKSPVVSPSVVPLLVAPSAMPFDIVAGPRTTVPAPAVIVPAPL